MIYRLEKTVITTAFEITKGTDDYLVQWCRIITGSKQDVRHRITVLKNHGNDINEKWDRVINTDFIIHDHMPTVKRSKKYLQIALETI